VSSTRSEESLEEWAVGAVDAETLKDAWELPPTSRPWTGLPRGYHSWRTSVRRHAQAAQKSTTGRSEASPT